MQSPELVIVGSTRPCYGRLHSIKNTANIKRTKWYESSSSIGPKIEKARKSCQDFYDRMNKANFAAATSSLDGLKKETKDFWNKHKDAHDPQVLAALKGYEDAADEALKGLREIVRAIDMLDTLDRAGNLQKFYASMHID